MKVKGEAQPTAAGVAIEDTRRRPIRLKFPFRLFVFLFILLLLISSGFFAYLRLFAGNTYTSESFSMVEQVQELATLTTAEALVTTIIKEEDNKLFNKDININFPGTKRTLLLIVPATVLAGVDLKAVTEESFIIDEETKEISLTIPHAKILQDPSIQMDKVQTYSEEGLFRSDVKWDEGFDLAAAAKTQIKAEAIELGLLTKAEESAIDVLSQFFKALGYTAQIQFQ